MRRILALAALAAVALLAAACSTTHTVTTTVTATPPPSSVKAPAPAIQQPASTCPEGQAFMGCSTPPQPPRLMLAPAPAGPKFPDVSNYQGHPNWAAAKSSIAGAVFKIGESDNYIDVDAGYNNNELKRLGIPRAGYWFDRPVPCNLEGAKLEATAKALGLRLVIIDQEVSGLSGHAACLNPYAKAATGHNEVIYRSAGNDYDDSAGSLPCWVAAYGPSKPPACGGRALKAWQMTDGRYGFPVYIPGVGQGDVSVDYGLISMINASKPKPKPSPHYNWLPNTRRTFHVKVNGKQRTIHAREQMAARQWGADKCRNPVKRKVCRTLREHMKLLSGRISFVAHHTGKHLKHQAKKVRWGAVHYRAGKHKTTLGGALQQFLRRESAKNHGVVTAWR